MKRKRYTEEQIAFALRQHDWGTVVEEILRKMGTSEPTFYRWKKMYAGLGVAELRRLGVCIAFGITSFCAANNVPERVVMEWIGHADGTMVRHCFHLHDEEAQRRMSGLNLLGGDAGCTVGERFRCPSRGGNAEPANA